MLRETDPNARLTTFTLAFPHAGALDEGPVAARTAEFVGAEAHMVHLTEPELVGAFEDTVWHSEEPVLSFHGPGKFLLSKFVREKGYKVVLTGGGADEFFMGYPWLPLEYLRRADPAGAALGLDLPNRAERHALIERINTAMAAKPRMLMSANSQTDAETARAMLGGISTHREFAAVGCPGEEIHTSAVHERTGELDVTMSIAEGIRIDGQVHRHFEQIF
ncbi:hypothetical protein C8R43DRAFT_485210 [Mycena crocata]|nr:hypothetical protein C8R43DRAFT_485210 [Mycena crocata]